MSLQMQPVKRVDRLNKFWVDIREMLTKEDLYECEALFRSAHEELVPHIPFDMDAIVRHEKYKLADPERLSYNGWVAYREGKPIGFIIGSVSPFYYSYDKQCRLDVWYVSKEYRGSPVAFLLLKALIKWGALRGAIRTLLDIVVDKHTVKQFKAFERLATTKLGFRKAGAFFVRDYNASSMDDKRHQ